MRRVLAVLATLVLVGASVAWSCSAWLTGEAVVTVRRNSHSLPRTVRLCYYDHLGEPIILTLPTYSACPVSTNVRHHNEDRDGDGRMDDEEGDE